MASPNVELVRSIYAAWERGDYSSVEWAHQDIEYVIADGPHPGHSTGSDIAHVWGDVLAAWEDFRVEADDIRELDEERVLVLTTYTGRGRTSGLDIGRMQPRGASVMTIREGKVVQQLIYFDRDRGLAELGL